MPMYNLQSMLHICGFSVSTFSIFGFNQPQMMSYHSIYYWKTPCMSGSTELNMYCSRVNYTLQIYLLLSYLLPQISSVLNNCAIPTGFPAFSSPSLIFFTLLSHVLKWESDHAPTFLIWLSIVLRSEFKHLDMISQTIYDLFILPVSSLISSSILNSTL